MDADYDREAKGEGHGRQLGNDGEGPILHSASFRSPVGPNVISTYISAVSYAEWWGFHMILVGVMRHGVLGIFHLIM